MEQNLSNGGADKPVPLDYASPKMGQRRIGLLGILAIIVASLVIFLVLAAILTPSPFPSPGAAAQRACALKLHQITLAASNYAGDHGGVLPNSYSLLFQPIKYLFRDCLICMVADDQTAVVGSRGSFVYCGGGLTTKSNPRSVVAYEHPANHPKENRVNIAYLDGSVGIADIPQAMKVIAELQAGHNPPRPEMLK